MANAASFMIPAFPKCLASDVALIAERIPDGVDPPTKGTIGIIHFRNAELHIPARIYSPQTPDYSVSGFSIVQRKIFACWYTRHHNGFIRERYLRQLFPDMDAWCIPYVIALVGEYVPEIIEFIDANANALSKDGCQDFARENDPFLTLLRDRVISYWLLWRSRYPVFRDYPGFRVLTKLGLWDGDQGKRLLQ